MTISAYTTRTRLAKPDAQHQNWDADIRAALDMIDEAFGVSSVAVAGVDFALSASNNVTDQSRPIHLVLTGTPGATRNITLPNVDRIVFVQNNTNAAQTIKCGGGTSVSLPAGAFAPIRTDGASNTTARFIAGGNGGTSLVGSSNATINTLTVADILALSGTTACVRFPAVQAPSAGANDLDDYEEGTWTPGLTFLTTAGSTTYNNRTGRYTKIGEVVIVRWAMEIAAVTGTGTAAMTGYPFVPATNVVGVLGNPPGANAMTGTVAGMYEALAGGQNQSTMLVGLNTQPLTHANFANAGMTFAGGMAYQT